MHICKYMYMHILVICILHSIAESERERKRERERETVEHICMYMYVYTYICNACMTQYIVLYWLSCSVLQCVAVCCSIYAMHV